MRKKLLGLEIEEIVSIIMAGCIIAVLMVRFSKVDYGKPVKVEVYTLKLKQLNRISDSQRYYKCANCEKVYLLQGFD